MKDYRLYFVGPNGHFARVEALEAPDDDAALALAEAHSDGRAMELWRRDRKVKTFGAGWPEQRNP